MTLEHPQPSKKFVEDFQACPNGDDRVVGGRPCGVAYNNGLPLEECRRKSRHLADLDRSRGRPKWGGGEKKKKIFFWHHTFDAPQGEIEMFPEPSNSNG